MRDMWLGDIYSQSPTASDDAWRMVFNIINPRWTDIPLILADENAFRDWAKSIIAALKVDSDYVVIRFEMPRSIKIEFPADVAPKS